jgi:uncharacterized protein (TIGR02147 family)
MKAAAIIKQYFERKQDTNPAYSLRALARDLKVSPSYVSGVLNGQKKISQKSLTKLVRTLDIDDEAALYLKMALLLEDVEDTELRKRLESPVNGRPFQKFRPISRKKNALLSKWYYVAVLDLMTCVHFKSDTLWIARQLGILLSEAEDAIETLKKLKLIEETSAGWRKRSEVVRVPRANSTEIRQFHKQMIEKALADLQFKTQPEQFEKRMFGGITMAVSPGKIKEARQKLNAVLHEIADDLIDGESTEVYQLNFQLFPLTK